MSLVVSDTSPIRALAHLNLVWVLERLYTRVLVPPAVADELSVDRKRSRAVEIARFPFLEIREPTDRQLVDELLTKLDDGEAEAIALALEVGADAVRMDETAGRTLALQYRLKYTGVLGVLTNARDVALIPAVRPLADRLRNEIDFYLSQSFYDRFMQSIGE